RIVWHELSIILGVELAADRVTRRAAAAATPRDIGLSRQNLKGPPGVALAHGLTKLGGAGSRIHDPLLKYRRMFHRRSSIYKRKKGAVYPVTTSDSMLSV